MKMLEQATKAALDVLNNIRVGEFFQPTVRVQCRALITTCQACEDPPRHDVQAGLQVARELSRSRILPLGSDAPGAPLRRGVLFVGRPLQASSPQA